MPDTAQKVPRDLDDNLSSDGRIRRGQLTRKSILNAAGYCFAERGYDHVSIREIAARAKIDKALIIRYFGSKEKLFIACVETGMMPSEDAAKFAADPHVVARRVAGIDGPTSEYAMLLACVRSTGAESTNDFIRDVFEERTLKAASETHPSHSPQVRTALIAAFTMGLVLTRNVLGMRTLQALDKEELAAWIEPVYEVLLSTPVPDLSDKSAQ